MKYISLLKSTLCAAAVTSTVVSCVPEENDNNGSQEKPNILVFIADDAGMDFGCYGNPAIKTPNIDKLAAEGMKFENAFVTAPQCSPCRTSILSGKFAHTIGTEELHTGIDSTTVLLPSYLKDAGYYTGLMLKHHIGEHGIAQFDYFNKESVWPEYYGTGEYNDKMMDYFRAFLDSSDTKPFFLWMGFIDPHRPYLDSPRKKNHAEQVHDPADVIVPPYLDDNDSTRSDLAQYYDEIHRMDTHIGWMLEELEKQGKLDNTLVIFFSDNGMPFPRAKMTCYDAGIKTPFIVRWKDKIKTGSTYEGLTSLIDLSPTLMDVAGMKKPDDMYGKSILPVFSNQDEPGREYIFAERNKQNYYDYIRAVRTKEYKLIYNALPEFGLYCDDNNPTGREMRRRFENDQLAHYGKRCFEKPEPELELYDIKEDPYELNNLADDPDMQEKKEKLLSVLKQWQKETGDFEADPERYIEQEKSGD